MLILFILAFVFMLLYCKACLEWADWLETVFSVLSVVVALALIINGSWCYFVQKDYEPVSVMVTTEAGVVEVNDEDYYKDDDGNYYTIVGEERTLWVPFCLPTFEKVDAPVFEYDNLNPHPPEDN